MGWTDLITLKELSPELRELIMAGGGEGVISGNPIFIDSVYTKKVVATEQDQVEFEIPFEEFDTVNTYLDVKINSTWINPDRYTIQDGKIILSDGVELGKAVYFTIFSLAQITPDGGYIQDVEVAETPQEVIIYDDSIIDEKVSAHNDSEVAHEDIRGLIDGKSDIHEHPYASNNHSHSDLENQINILNGSIDMRKRTQLTTGQNLDNLTVGFHGSTNSGLINTLLNKPPDLTYGEIFIDVYYIANGYKIQKIKHQKNGIVTNYERALDNNVWKDWIKQATTEKTDSLDNKIGVLTDNMAGYRIYQSVRQIIPSGATTTRDVAKAMIDKSILIFNANNTDITDLPYTWCLLEITRVNSTYITMKATSTGGKDVWFANYHSVNGAYSGWQQMASTSKIDNLPLLNGWGKIDVTCDASVNRCGDLVTVSMRVTNATVFSNTMSSVICVLPIGYRPPTNTAVIREVKLRNSTHYGSVYIYDNGEIKINNYPTSNLQLAFDISYSV